MKLSKLKKKNKITKTLSSVFRSALILACVLSVSLMNLPNQAKAIGYANINANVGLSLGSIFGGGGIGGYGGLGGYGSFYGHSPMMFNPYGGYGGMYGSYYGQSPVFNPFYDGSSFESRDFFEGRGYEVRHHGRSSGSRSKPRKAPKIDVDLSDHGSNYSYSSRYLYSSDYDYEPTYNTQTNNTTVINNVDEGDTPDPAPTPERDPGEEERPVREEPPVQEEPNEEPPVDNDPVVENPMPEPCTDCPEPPDGLTDEQRECRDNNDLRNYIWNSVGITAGHYRKHGMVRKDGRLFSNYVEKACVNYALENIMTVESESSPTDGWVWVNQKACENGNISIDDMKKYQKPCLSPSYRQVAHATIENTVACLGGGAEGRAFMGMMMQESGLNLNPAEYQENTLISHGFGQMAYGNRGIKDVNKNGSDEWSSLKSQPGCGAIVNYLSSRGIDSPIGKISNSRSKGCDSISTSNENPVINAIYAMIHFKQNQKYGESILRNSFSKVQRQVLETNPDYQKLKRYLGILSYNQGSRNVQGQLKAFAQEVFKGRDLSELNVDSLIDRFNTHYKKAKGQTRTYVDKTEKRLSDALNQVNASRARQGLQSINSCVK
jgi:hypothetical protein